MRFVSPLARLLFAMAAALPIAAVAANVSRGEQIAQQQCAACHGKDFVTGIDPAYPILAGQYADYLNRSLRDYQTGARKNAIMAGIAKPLTRDDIRDLSAYLSRLPGPLDNRKR